MFTMGQKMDASNPEGSFLESSANDYFEKGAVRQGQWFGKLAKEWGLTRAPVAKKDYIAVMNHVCPKDGKPLTTGTSKINEIAWFPFQCGAQKSVSVMAMLMNDQRLVDAHHECVQRQNENNRQISCRPLRSRHQPGTRPAAAYPLSDRQCNG